MMETPEKQILVYTKKEQWMMLIAICMGAFLSHFTAGVVNVSLPRFTQLFQADLGTIQWITTGYLLIITVLLPLMGKMGDRYGHRLIHNAGYIFFAVSSVLVACSPNLAVLLICRMVQAIGAAMFQATNLALVTIHMPPEQRGQSLGMVSTAVALGAMTGPFAGGIITQWLSWHWLFLIHVPVAFVATLLAYRYIPVHKVSKTAAPLDITGALLFIVVIGAFIFGISQGNEWGWTSVKTISVIGLALIALVLFLLWERRHATPFLPLQVFRNPSVSSGLLVSCVSFLLANTVLIVMPFYLSDIAGHSPSTVGLMMTAYPLLLAITSPVAGRLSDQNGSRRFIFIGLGSMGVGLSFYALFLDQLSMLLIMTVLALIGAGMGFVASPNNSFIMRHVPSKHVGSIGGLIAVTRNAGMVLGASLGFSAMNGKAESYVYTFAFQLAAVICFISLVTLFYGVRRSQSQDNTSPLP